MELAKRALLVSVTIRLEGLLGERRDKQASELVTSTYSAQSKRAKASKFLIDRRHPKVKAVIAAAQQVRAVAYRYTFPWGDSGLRLLPVKAHPLFATKMDEALRDLKATQAEYLLYYPSLVKASESELGRLFDLSQYPEPERVANLFKSGVEYWPMPEGGHFVADIAAESAKEARDTLTKANLERTNEAVNDLIGRVERTVQMYVDKLAAYKPKAGDTDGRIEGIFRDSLVENVADMSRLIKALNFTDDAGLNGLATQVDRLARHTASSLRDDKDIRTSMISEGQALINKLDSFRKVDTEVDNLIASIADYR